MTIGAVTIHDACPAFSPKIFKFSNELERLSIKYNIALVPFFNEKEDLSLFPDFVDQIKSDAKLFYMVFITRIETVNLTISSIKQKHSQKRRYLQVFRYFRR